MSKHTQGPWEWNEDRTALVGPNKKIILQDGEGVWDLCSYMATVHDKPKESEANARLIAAAPDLLQALQMMLACCYDLECDDEVITAVLATRAAIAKATGSAS